MKALTCAFLTLGLVLATCAGCGSATPATKSSVPPPGTGGNYMEPDTGVQDPSTAAGTQATEETKEVVPEKATENPVEAKPGDAKKTDEKPSDEKPADDKKSEDK